MMMMCLGLVSTPKSLGRKRGSVERELQGRREKEGGREGVWTHG